MTVMAQELVASAERTSTSELVKRYLADGFTVTVEPPADSLPAFFADYRPDAIAVRLDRNIAIEVINGHDAARLNLSDLKRQFEGHPTWELHVIVAPKEPIAKRITVPDKAQIEAELASVKMIAQEVGPRPAFVGAWTLLEAVSHAVPQGSSLRPRKPSTTVATLGAMGLLDNSDIQKLNELIPARNAIVHGDLSVAVEPDQLELVLLAIQKVLNSLEQYAAE